MRVLFWLLPVSVACSTMPVGRFEERLEVVVCNTHERCEIGPFEECFSTLPPRVGVDEACLVDAQSARQCLSAWRHLDCDLLYSIPICSETIDPCRADDGVQ